MLYSKMENHSILLLFSGIETHVSADEYAPFEANRNFFYLTGLRRDHMILLMDKSSEEEKTTLFIEEPQPLAERWMGKKVTVEEAQSISQIDEVKFLDCFESVFDRIMTRSEVYSLYFDCYRHQLEDLPDYNLTKAQEFAAKYPGCALRNLFPLVARMRMSKDANEVEKLRRAIVITDESLQFVMRHLVPNKKEYQVQADFEYMIHTLGADGVSFPTIAGSGKNGTMLHYSTNQDTCADGSLILLDLGAKYQGYCADITRTYPVNGRFSERQRRVYDVVLQANRTIAKVAKPGMTTKELNEICKKVLAKGCMELGLIQNESEIETYYMHGVSHYLGIDVHDVTVADVPLEPGAVISDEPGLYIDEWEIGIRIEDDLLITEDGCEVLSDSILRDADEIEAFMANNR